MKDSFSSRGYPWGVGLVVLAAETARKFDAINVENGLEQRAKAHSLRIKFLCSVSERPHNRLCSTKLDNSGQSGAKQASSHVDDSRRRLLL